MGCDLIKRLLPVLVIASAVLDGQEPIPAKTILDLDEGAQIAFINQTIALGFPEDRGDQMTMLIINRSVLALPLIESKLEEALKLNSTPRRFVDTATEMIAYAGDEQSLRAISKLLAIDEKRFGSLVERTLGNAVNLRNPFTVAYKGLELGDEAVSRRAMAWAELALVSGRMQRAWVLAMLDRYGKVPSEEAWTQDPIVSRLKDGASPELRQNVLMIAEELQQKRVRQ